MNLQHSDAMLVADSDRVHEEDLFSSRTNEVIEVPLLLSAEQVAALEEAAHDRGLTTGEMLRRLLEEFIAGSFNKLPVF